MFKKAKRVNFRRRNKSDDDEKEDIQLPQPCGPAAEDPSARVQEGFNPEPFAVVNFDVHHGNGLQTNAVKAVKDKEKKKNKDSREAPKASLLSFQDDEDDTEVFRVKKPNHSKKIVKQLKKEYKEDLEKTGDVKQDSSTGNDEVAGLLPVGIKEEPRTESSRASSEQGEEEMEVDSTEDQEEDSETRSTPGGAFSNTLSSLSTLRPGTAP